MPRREIQRSWRHIINNLRAAAARATSPGTEIIRGQYGRLCGLYGRIRSRDTASESEWATIPQWVYRMAMP